MKELTGQQFGHLTVLGYDCKKERGRHWWKCRCICGKEKSFEQWHLLRSTSSCGCLRYKHIDLTNKRFGKLLAISFDHFDNGSYWKCKCDCGKEHIVRTNNLTGGWTTSCGCAKNVYGKERAGFLGYEGISGTCFSSIRTNARKRKIEFDLTIEFLWKLFTEQNRRCSLSGMEIQFATSSLHREEGTASLDRIDPSQGYVVGNVQWVHKDINFMKYVYTQEHFIELCGKVTRQFSDKEHG